MMHRLLSAAFAACCGLAAAMPAQRPKDYVALSEWPRTAAGKLDRARLAALAAAQLKGGTLK